MDSNELYLMPSVNDIIQSPEDNIDTEDKHDQGLISLTWPDLTCSYLIISKQERLLLLKIIVISVNNIIQSPEDNTGTEDKHDQGVR